MMAKALKGPDIKHPRVDPSGVIETAVSCPLLSRKDPEKWEIPQLDG